MNKKEEINSFTDPEGWKTLDNALSLLNGYINYLSKAKANQNQVKESPEPYSNDILTVNY